MIIVLDASAAIEIALDRPKSRPLAALVPDADWVIAPDLFASEVTQPTARSNLAFC